MMAAALGPPEVIAQLENAAKVLMVSAPRPAPASTASREPRPPRRPVGLLGLPGAAEGRRRYGAGVSILLSCRVPFLGLRLPCLCGWGNRVIWAAVSTRICPQPGYRAGGGRWALRVPLD